MKKILILLSLLCVAIMSNAQLSIETALPLQEGNNSYTFESSASGEQTVYYTYTAPEEQGKLVAFTASNSSTNCQMSEDGTYATSITGVYTNNYTTVMYPVKPGQTVILAVGGYNVTEVEFNIEISDADVEGGATCDDAITLSENDVFIPSYYNYNTYVVNPTYLTYTATEDGVLEITFSNSVSSMTAQIGCDATTTESLSVNSVTGKYVAKYEVKSNTTYIFQVFTYSPLMASAALTHPIEGLSCDLPFEGNTNNTLPKETGKYWYEYTPEKDGYMIVTSENSLSGGTISIWASCTAYQAEASIDGYFALRSRVNANNKYLICIEKTESTETDEEFTITIEDKQAGDDSYTPITIDGEGTYPTPKYNGTYYYSITVPEGDNRFLVVDATNANISNNNTSVGIYDQYNTYTPLASGSNKVKAEVIGGYTYYIIWECREGINTFDFTISYEQIAPGETCSNPLIAVKGANDLSAGDEKYYSYTATQTGWLVIDTDITIDVTFLRDCNEYSGIYYATKTANITKAELKEGESCIIKFANITDETTFFLNEEEYLEGESCEKAIEIEMGDTAIPGNAGSYWYRFTATQSCMVTIASDIIYEQATNYSRYSAVYVKTNCEEYGNNITSSNADGTIFEGNFIADEGDVFYINVVTLSAQEGKKLSISTRDLQPGESCTTPIEITTGELTIPIVNRSNPIWYSIILEPGEFSITSSNYQYFSMYMYDNCDTDTYIASSQYDNATSGYSLKFTVTNTGTYYLKLDGSYNEITVEVKGKSTALESIEQNNGVRVIGNNINITVDNTRTDVAIYDISGKVIATQAVYDNASFTVDYGIYIVKVGNSIHKVVVK